MKKSVLRYIAVFIIAILIFNINVAFADEISSAVPVSPSENVPTSDTVISEVPDTPVEDIVAPNFKTEMETGDTQDISATIIPSNATDQTLTYFSSNTKVAVVSSSGTITGISAGATVITIEAGDFKKTFALTVNTATISLELNSMYVILSPGKTFTLTATIVPNNAVQKLTYTTSDQNIITVSTDGIINALSVGTGAVVVSNGDISKVVTVIVNAGSSDTSSVLTSNTAQLLSNNQSVNSFLIESLSNLDDNGEMNIEMSSMSVVTPDILRALYGTNKNLTVVGADYSITILGKDIVNISNELQTNCISLKKNKNLECDINNGKDLPGKIEVQLKDSGSYKHIYLYNTVKKKYEMINALTSNNQFTVDSNGKYLLTNSSLSDVAVNWIIIAIIGLLLVISLAVYVLVKKRYWFW